MAPHTITRAVGAKAGFRPSPRGLHSQTQLSSLPRWNLDWSLGTTWFHSTAVVPSFVVSGTTPDGGVRGSTRNHKCPSAGRLRTVRGDPGAPSGGATCA
ncbi:hypothetical protein TNCV_5055441 [Trichonephila clavipes]|nr:hypothetical protein TNCV_5055441 [Trichonephila clavipes]